MDAKTIETLTALTAMLRARKQADASKSYVASLYQKGAKKIAQKVGEEAVETAMAVAADDNQDIIAESADLLFHLMVLLEARGLSLNEVVQELARREGISGIAEKANRNQ